MVDEAHGNYLIGNFDEAVRLLKSIKLQVTNKEGLLDEILKQEKILDDDFNKRKVTEVYPNSTDELHYNNKLIAAKKYLAEEYISFYNRIKDKIP